MSKNMSTKSDFKAMSVAELKKYLQERGVSVSGHLKSSLVEIASAVESMILPVDPHFEKDKATADDVLIIHDMQIPNQFSLKTVNNFNSTPPFGLYDIFNHLIYHSTEYDKQGLASYKSFDDYRLFNDGFVESLLTTYLDFAGIHVYVGKVRPSMKPKTDDGQNFYDLWFILEGKGPNKGSVLMARCKCKGGRDGGCKHIAAAMYSLEDLLHSRSTDSVTSGPCLWVKRPTSSTKPCEVKSLKVEKIRKPSHKKQKRGHLYSQVIDVDVRAENDRSEPDFKYLEDLTNKMHKMTKKPAIFPLFKKLYGLNLVPETPKVPLSCENGILHEKVNKLLLGNPLMKPEQVAHHITFTDEEITKVSQTTIQQCKCEAWYLQKSGFITASICKRVFTRQETLEKKGDEDPTKLVDFILQSEAAYNNSNIRQDKVPENAREWGLKHENSARHAYQRLASHKHHKLSLICKGFLISQAKPFLGASIDNLQTCECADGCIDAVVEYKCPWKYRDTDPKEAFVSPELGGYKDGDKYGLKRNSKYYYQVQLQMFVTKLKLCHFVVWTTKGILHLEISFDHFFMLDVCEKLEKFWISHVLPAIMSHSANEPSGVLLQEPSIGTITESPEESSDIPEPENLDVSKSAEELEDNARKDEVSVMDLTSATLDSQERHNQSPVNAFGLDIYPVDVQTLTPGTMINDTVLAFLLQQLSIPYPIVSSFFYTTLCGEQDVGQRTTRLVRMQSSEKFFNTRIMQNDYIFIPINRSLHWFLAILTPWHLLFLDSLTWDITTRKTEVENILGFLDHYCKKYGLLIRTSNLSSHAMKVPQQSFGSNNCGFHMFMFISHFVKELKEYKGNPSGYVATIHNWFDPGDAEQKRTETRTSLSSLFNC